MSKKVVSAGVITSPASGANTAAKAATRRKAHHPKFELPEEHGHATTDWAFRDEAHSPRIAVMPTAADIAAVEYHPVRHHQQPPQMAAPWEGPMFLSRAIVAGAAVGLGIAMLTGYAAIQMMTAPARIARSLF